MIRRLLEWEYHKNYVKHSKNWSEEAIFNYSATTLAGNISLFYFFPFLLIVASLVVYYLDYLIKLG